MYNVFVKILEIQILLLFSGIDYRNCRSSEFKLCGRGQFSHLICEFRKNSNAKEKFKFFVFLEVFIGDFPGTIGIDMEK
jgi:hypothetical protein